MRLIFFANLGKIACLCNLYKRPATGKDAETHFLAQPNQTFHVKYKKWQANCLIASKIKTIA